MADTFFGFNTTLPMDDDGGGIEDEGEYDVFNDETFGEAKGGDWESLHENLVRMDSSENPKNDMLSNKFDEDDSDLDINFTRVLLDDCDLSNDDPENRVQLDPSVWASPDKSMIQQRGAYSHLSNIPDTEYLLRQRFSQQIQQQQQQPQTMFGGNSFGMPVNNNGSNGQPKMLSLADLERNIMGQQQKNTLEKFLLGMHNDSVNNKSQQPPPLTPQKQMMMNNQRQAKTPIMVPPGLHMPPRGAPGFPPQMHPPPHPLLNPCPPPHGRFPPGFPPNFFPPTGGRPMPPNMQMPFNNFNQLPPNFGPMRGPPPLIQHPAQQSLLQQPLVSPHFQQNSNNLQNSVNQFNQRLLQEIQQNHPLLSMNRSNNNTNNYQAQQQYNNSNNMNGQYHQQQQHQYNRNNGNVNQTEFDPYANMMSQRDKHWLLGIQLMQLNTETPYIDDFYYIVYKDREKKRKGDLASSAHANNKNNHPFTQQPNRGYAQLMFMSLNKNGMTNHHHQNKNGMQNRERKNSENSTNKDKDQQQQQTPRTYTPLQFENSLGKLQCGSVTAPRKIIDMEVVGPDANSQLGTTSEISAQRKSRQILLHIETMYKIVLKLEDLKNPIAIATAVVVRQKQEEKERLAAIEAATAAAIIQLENDEKLDGAETVTKILLTTNTRNDSVKLTEMETRADLLPRLLAGLTPEKVTTMMTVRKGRTLLKRTLPHIRDCGPQKWEVWCGIYTSLLIILKKEKDDTEGNLINLFYEFEKDLQTATVDEITKLARIMQTVIEKMTIYVFDCKFCISSIFALILHSEHLNQIATTNNTPFDLTTHTEWTSFIQAICNSVRKITKIKNISASIDSESHRILTTHFKKFSQVDSAALLEIVTKTD